jgi:hypothetical protein
MAIIRDNRGALLASNLSKYVAGAANTAGTPIDTMELVGIVNQFLGTGDQIKQGVANIGSNGIYKQFMDTDKITNKTQIVTTGIWSGDTGSLAAFYTSSTDVTSDLGKYYINVYNKDTTASDSEVQFSLAYGDVDGYGAPTLTQDPTATSPTVAIYKQLRNVLLGPTDRYFSVYSGSTPAGSDLRNFYVININRSRYKERMDPGNVSLTLSGSKGTVTLIDDSGGTDENVTTAGRIYNMVSGSLNIGAAATSSIQQKVDTYTQQGYGLFYPDLGVILLNPTALSASVGTINGASLKPANSSIANVFHNNSLSSTTYTGTSGSIALLRSIEAGDEFAARRTENVSTSHYFIRVNNREYNFSNNPSFVTGSSGQFIQGLFERDPHVYVTTVGLYNDAHELLAVAKTSKPVEKTFDKEIAIKVKLDF